MSFQQYGLLKKFGTLVFEAASARSGGFPNIHTAATP